MTNDELDRSLRQLRLGGMADALLIRSQQARAESLGPLDFIGLLVHDELQRRRDRLIERRVKAAGFRDQRTLDTFDWKFNSLDRALIFELANCRFIEQHEDVLLLGNAGVGKSHIAQAIGMAAIHAGFRVLYREAHVLFEDLLLARASGQRSCSCHRGVQRNTATDYRRLRDAQVAGERRRGFTRNRDAPVRARLNDLDVKSADRGLGETLRRHAGGCSLPRSPNASLAPHRDSWQKLPTA